MRTLGGWASENEVMAASFIRPPRDAYAVVRQGADDELSSSPVA